MIRLALVVVLLAPACLFVDSDHPGDIPPRPPIQCSGGICVTKDHPFRFGNGVRFGVGTEVEIAFVVHSTLGAKFEVVASGPALILVDQQRGVAIVRGLSAGLSHLIARRTDSGEELATIGLETVDVATIGFSWRREPVASEPVASLAAIAGGNDEIGVVLRDGNGVELVGSAPVTIDNDVVVLAHAEWYGLDAPFERMRFGINALHTGTARATVALFDGQTATLPIEVVSAPATLAIVLAEFVPTDILVPAPAKVHLDELVEAGIVGKTVDGRFVAGIFATWSAAGPAEVHHPYFFPRTPEAQLQVTGAGPITLVADIGGMTATTTLEAR